MNRRLVVVTAALCAALLLAVCASVSSADFVLGENMTVKTKDTPRLRLEQTAEEFPAQTWDVASNHLGFFIRDLSHEATLPFRIKPDAPTDSLTVGENGNVGVGRADPSAGLEVYRYGQARTLYTDPARNPDASWSAGIPSLEDSFGIGPDGAVPVLLLKPDAEALVSGSISEAANTGTVTDLQNVNPAGVLAKVASLPIQSWRFSKAPSTVRHLGPLADYFGPAFGLGRESHISPADVAGVSLAAIQGLVAQNAGLDARDSSLEAKNANLAASVKRDEAANEELSRRVGSLAKQLKSLRRAVHRVQ
jgi:hypothetical protein